MLDGVRVERERLAPLRARATRVIDTTNTSVHDLRRILVAHFGPASGGAPRMVTRIVSFGFKFGSPVDADVVLDVRFLDNPYFVPELKVLTGLDEPVADYVLATPETQEFLRRTRGAPRVRPSALRARGKELPDHRDRVHGRQAPVGRHRRGAGPPALRVHRRFDWRGPSRHRARPVRSATRARTRSVGERRVRPVERTRAQRCHRAATCDRRKWGLGPRPRRGAVQPWGQAMSESVARFKIVNQLGLHARAATKLVQLASKYPVRGRGGPRGSERERQERDGGPSALRFEGNGDRGARQGRARRGVRRGDRATHCGPIR